MSAWGKSWGAAWGVAFGAIAAHEIDPYARIIILPAIQAQSTAAVVTHIINIQPNTYTVTT